MRTTKRSRQPAPLCCTHPSEVSGCFLLNLTPMPMRGAAPFAGAGGGRQFRRREVFNIFFDDSQELGSREPLSPKVIERMISSNIYWNCSGFPCNPFMCRGVESARSERRLACSAHNLLMLFRGRKARWRRIRIGLMPRPVPEYCYRLTQAGVEQQAPNLK